MSKPTTTAKDVEWADFSENVTLALRIIDRLLANPIGNQLYAKEIQMLFKLIGTQELPPIIVKDKP